MQTKLLRVLQEKTFERVGGNETIQSNFRLISATNADLKQEIEAGRFRLDLYYRLNILPIEIPPLRERRQDIPLLANYFIETISREMGRKIDSIEVSVMQMLKKYSWPGNIRELRNIIERLVVMAQDGKISGDDLPIEIQEIDSDMNRVFSEDLKGATQDFEKEYIMEIMRRNSWNVTKASREMNIARKTLYKKLNDYGIKYR